MKDLTFVITGLTMGGAELSLVRLVNWLSNHQNVNITILSLTPASPTIKNALKTQCRLIEVRSRIKVFSFFIGLYYLLKINPKILHGHMVHANVLCMLYTAISPSTNTVITAHSTDEGFLCFAYKYLSRFVKVSTHISRVGLLSYIERGYFKSDKSVYIPNGLEPLAAGVYKNPPRRIKRSKAV